MRFLELFLLRMVLWIGLPVLLVMMAVGPKRLWNRIKFGWNWLFCKRLDPEEILSQVVEQHEQHVAALRKVLAQAEATEAQVLAQVERSEKSVAAFDQEAVQFAAQGDELGARAALYKLNLEKSAIESFREQHKRLGEIIPETRQRLYLLELRLRQYEVGRSVLLSQLAEAEKIEQQYAIARQFDPFNAVADWQRAEGIVQDKAVNARAIERVYMDTTEMTADVNPTSVDPEMLEAQLAELRARVQAVATQSHAPAEDSLPAPTKSEDDDSPIQNNKRSQKH